LDDGDPRRILSGADGRPRDCAARCGRRPDPACGVGTAGTPPPV